MQTLAIIASVDFQKLLLGNEERNIGGTASVIKNILNYLHFDLILLLGITNKKSELNTIIPISQKIIFIPIVYIPIRNIIPQRLHVFYKSRVINKFLKRYDIDVIYSHSMEMSFWLDKNLNTVEHMHGAVNAINLSKYDYLRIRLISNLWEFIRKKVLLKAKQIIAIDEACFELASKYNNQRNIHLIRNFVDTTVYFRDKNISGILSKNTKSKIVLFVGRIEEVKGLQLFVDAIAELRKHSNEWIGVVVGKGTYEETLRSYISYQQMDDAIVFTGPVYDQNELRKIYNQAEILLLTSYHEGIPMTILESLACGTPVLATDVGGISKLADGKMPCFIMKERNALLFANKIFEITASPKMEYQDFPYSSLSISKKINKILKNEER